MVFCPIDCVSHQACLKVKALCRRRAKPFVPLRSSSATCFFQAMKVLQSIPTPDGRPHELMRRIDQAHRQLEPAKEPGQGTARGAVLRSLAAAGD